MFLLHDGKPLISVYTDARTTAPPTWIDPALTVRWMGAFREIVLNPGGQWSWTDRVAYANGVETPIADFTVDKLKGWKVTGEWAVNTIKTHQALRVDVETVAATSKPADGVNQKVGTLTSPPFTITERAFAFNAIGFDMSAGDDLPNLNGRNVFLLRDAHTNKILRHITPRATRTGSTSASGTWLTYSAERWFFKPSTTRPTQDSPAGSASPTRSSSGPSR